MRRAETLTLSPPPLSFSEIYRYLGQKDPTPEVAAQVDRAVALGLPHFTYRALYRILSLEEAEAFFGDLISGSGVRRRLAGCTHLVVFAATVGHAFDRLLAREGRKSASLALCLQALGAERIEGLCDALETRLAEEQGGKFLFRKRFSPGYGDFPLEAQKRIFALLGCEEGIGLTLCDSLLMSPTKSVTALVGLEGRTHED